MNSRATDAEESSCKQSVGGAPKAARIHSIRRLGIALVNHSKKQSVKVVQLVNARLI